MSQGRGAKEQRGKGATSPLLPRSPAPSLPCSLAPALPYLALLGGMTCMAVAAIVVKWANAPGLVSGFYRMAIAVGIFALPFAREATRHAPSFGFAQDRLTARPVVLAAIAGAFFACDVALFYTSLLITSVANATLFANTSPVWVGLGSMILFKERLHSMFWGGVFLALSGMLVILSQDFMTHPTVGVGDLYSLSAGLFYGTFFLIIQRARQRLSPLLSWWISAAGSAVTLFGLSFIFNQSLIGYPPETYLNLAAVALLAQVGGWLAINYALGHLRASLVAPTLLGQPVLAALLAVPLLGQSIGIAQMIGGVLVIGGIFIVHRAKTN